MSWERVTEPAIHPRTRRLSPPRVLLVAYVATIAVGTFLLMLPVSAPQGGNVPFTDALFTATSAVCVTGLTVRETGADFSTFGQGVVLGLIQIGGLGIMTMSTIFALVLGRKIGLRGRMFIRDELSQGRLSGMVRLVRHVLLVTLAFELVGAAILFLKWRITMGARQAVYFSVFHSVSAFCNAGFDLFGDSFEGYVTEVNENLVITTLFILGGLGFGVLDEILFVRGRRRLSLHTRLVLIMSAILLVVGTLVIFLAERSNPGTMGGLSDGEKVMAAYFQAATPRTAGFSTIPTAHLRRFTATFVIMLMYIGASPGSTGGGVKTTTFLMVLLSAFAATKGHLEVEWQRRRIAGEILLRAVAIVVLSALFVSLSVLALMALEQMEPLSIVFETVSAFGTVGLSMGITEALSTGGRAVIILNMLFGRLGPLLVATAFVRKRKGRYRYAEDRLIVG